MVELAMDSLTVSTLILENFLSNQLSRAIDERELMKNHFMPYVKRSAFLLSILLKDMTSPGHEARGDLEIEAGEDEEPQRAKKDNLTTPGMRPMGPLDSSRRTSIEIKSKILSRPSTKMV